MNGGYGPGSYYPWIYLQMAIFIPLLRPICERMGKWYSLLVFIAISVVLELFCSLINLPDYVYRLLCIRYVFLIWAGWIWVKEGVRLNMLAITASLLSLLAIIYFEYFENQLQPWFYNTGWATHRWLCYFWVSFGFVGLLYKMYGVIKKNAFLKKQVMIIASASYEIFLVQMTYYTLIQPKVFDFGWGSNLQYGLWILVAFFVSIAGGVKLRKMEYQLF